MKTITNPQKQKKNFIYLVKTFRYAFSGFRFFFNKEIKSTIHLIAAFLAIAAGFIVKISFREWSLVCLCIGFVFCAEIMNTAIENLVDMISPKKNIKAGIIKDLGSAGVLVASCTAFAIAVFIYLPKIIGLIR